jgi:hypothetical protein
MTEEKEEVTTQAAGLFADLKGRPRIDEETLRILQYGPEIVEAHDRRKVSWKELAERLETVGITVSKEYLRALMLKHAADIKAMAKGSGTALESKYVITKKKAPKASSGGASEKPEAKPRTEQKAKPVAVAPVEPGPINEKKPHERTAFDRGPNELV